jgi:hypothetical protein
MATATLVAADNGVDIFLVEQAFSFVFAHVGLPLMIGVDQFDFVSGFRVALLKGICRKTSSDLAKEK